MMVCILYFNFKSKIILIHIITSRHYFIITLDLSITSKVCILLGASQQTRYVERWINIKPVLAKGQCYNTIAEIDFKETSILLYEYL